MVTYNVHEAKTHFSRLLARAIGGEEIVIARAGRPIAKIVPIQREVQRLPNTMRGALWVAEDFDAALPDDVLDDFEQGS